MATRLQWIVGGLIAGSAPMTVYFFYVLYSLTIIPDRLPATISPPFLQFLVPSAVIAAEYAAAYFFVYAKIAKNTAWKGIMPAILIGLTVVVELFILPLSLSLWISAYLIRRAEERRLKETTGRYSYEEVISELKDKVDNSAFDEYKARKRNMKKLTAALFPFIVAGFFISLSASAFLEYSLPLRVLMLPSGPQEGCFISSCFSISHSWLTLLQPSTTNGQNS